MKKEYIIGGLALVGGIALVAYLLKPKGPRRNSEGFFGVNGQSKFYTRRARCKRPNGTYYVTGEGQDYCTYGRDVVVAYIDK
jgi:hypothetical protein